MSYFTPHYTPFHNVGCPPAAYVAEVLDGTGVPNVLWGWWATSLVGRHKEVKFVIPDEKLEAALNALAAKGIRHCTDPICPELEEDQYPDERECPFKDPITDQHIVAPIRMAQALECNCQRSR
ncbi:hypothetical protein BJX76DRAFT_363083 [Aspergillus varians]